MEIAAVIVVAKAGVAAAVMKTTVATGKVGGTDNNQIKAAAEELAVATVAAMVAVMATATMTTMTARMTMAATATAMAEAFLPN